MKKKSISDQDSFHWAVFWLHCEESIHHEWFTCGCREYRKINRCWRLEKGEVYGIRSSTCYNKNKYIFDMNKVSGKNVANQLLQRFLVREVLCQRSFRERIWKMISADRYHCSYIPITETMLWFTFLGNVSHKNKI